MLNQNQQATFYEILTILYPSAEINFQNYNAGKNHCQQKDFVDKKYGCGIILVGDDDFFMDYIPIPMNIISLTLYKILDKFEWDYYNI